MNYTYHALDQYMSRTGRQGDENVLMTLRNAIETAKEVSYDEATEQGFKLIKRIKGDVYLIWHDDKIGEDVCGIVAKGKALKTVLTKDLYSWCRKSTKARFDMELRGREVSNG